MRELYKVAQKALREYDDYILKLRRKALQKQKLKNEGQEQNNNPINTRGL